MSEERKTKLAQLREKEELSEKESKHLDLLVALEKAEESSEGVEEAVKTLDEWEGSLAETPVEATEI